MTQVDGVELIRTQMDLHGTQNAFFIPSLDPSIKLCFLAWFPSSNLFPDPHDLSKSMQHHFPKYFLQFWTGIHIQSEKEFGYLVIKFGILGQCFRHCI